MNKHILVSAGDAITAKLVQQAGFNGIWVSGFEASARLGLADNGSITMTEMLNVVKPIVESVNIPVWVDTDTGYGNLKRTIIEFEKIGAYGICVEDNLPDHKQNSLWGEEIPLMDCEKFGKKLNCIGWDDRKIKIMARTETLIRGGTQEEALDRLKHYAECGADWVLPHTRKEENIIPNPDVWQTFQGVAKAKLPVAIVPTKFPQYTNEYFFSIGYSMVIWANQTERVKIKSIRESLAIMKEEDCAKTIENELSATLDDMKGLTPDE